MSKYLLTTALVAAVALGTAVFAHDGHMHHRSSQSSSGDENSFDAQMGRAMELMDRDMAVAPSGNHDRDFAAMMIPHHQDGPLQSLAAFMTNPAGAAIVNTVGPVRQLIEAKQEDARRYLVIAAGSAADLGPAVQIQLP